ncbi:arylsulfatase A-like enzyme [Parabacteroides sp. PF5-5]|uniref:sulfatase family protein n=1 Tax=unclassified Parabacteroides TaxID=2649774 RepID=UPI002474B324|nr:MULTISPECIES: sulfatase [unclassified Parabacteroides]MDH6305347.1 arylsulfatase A-like enzyme [Parabacteroides sp. PH5-39]MDH6316700.1 arylsulfatase A-like enzyme [Parabacteroides sp. PF5-13]MDH6320120.1 arylsulfatase A-like enzyme [Parabacteroides sp. PH5-13]MDH6323937.1 arylsulfatase A-like enzyme [Parabacteroides sp. PH5-8]MDH6327797.1 arylsulfatase A-like enzyme [Parabacteroides sp. PH5-41]
MWMKNVVAGGALLASASLQAQTPPNVVLIFLDDMGYGDLTITGASGYKTPTIDRLAKEGMFFSHFYAAQPISSASRAGIMTGCYPNRVGISGALMPQGNTGLNPNEETIAEVLKTKGYTCAAVGKWHLGHLKPFLPLQQGFDEYLGIPYSNDMWPVDYEGNRATPASNLPHKLRHPALPLIDGNEKAREIWTLGDQGELTTLYTERAVRFIKQNKEKPFFLYLAHSMPHVPLAVSDKFKGKSEQGLFGDVMMELDWSVQQILKTLEENGLDEQTLVIFTSDNGPWYNFGNHSGSNGGLREAKATTFDGGQRVPCLMRWKGVIPEGVVCNQLASTIDILPTLAALSGAALPQKKIDGVDISPLMKGETEVSPRDHFFYYYGVNNLEAVRDGRFKLIFPHKHATYLEPANDGFPGKVGQDKIGLSLYDLRRDPGERFDVKEMYPEVVERLSALAEKAREDMGDDLTKREGANRREIGKVN